MGVLFVLFGSAVGGAVFLGALFFMAFILKQMLGLFFDLGSNSNNGSIVIVMPKAKATERGRTDYAMGRELAQSEPFFEGVSGVDLEYRGLGTSEGGK